jgi:hypothetical protein
MMTLEPVTPTHPKRRGPDSDGEDNEDAVKDDEITELTKIEIERIDGVVNPANGIGILLIKSLAGQPAPGGGRMPLATDETTEPVMAKSDDDEVRDPDDGAPGDDVDGSGDSHEDDDDDTKDCAKEDAAPAAEPPAPSDEAVKAARQDYEEARRDYLAAEPGLKGTDTPTELLKARAEWNTWNTLGKDEGLDGSDEGAQKWVAKHLAEAVTVDEPLACSDQVIPPADDEIFKAIAEVEEPVYKRKFSAEQRRKAAAAGHALSDGSYPIENKEDLGNAAHLARSGHGNVSGAKALIRRRAKELGVANPLDDNNGSASKADSGDSDMPPGKKPCPTCKGKKTIKDGNMKCPACKGKGFMKPKMAAKMAATAAVDVALKAGAITQEQADDILAQVHGEAAKAARPLPSSVEPVAPHREPDGTSTIEQLEPEAGLGTDPDSTADKVPVSVSSLTMKEAPYAVRRAHDAFCAAYSGADVLEEYPAMKGIADAAGDAGTWFAGLATKAVEAGDVTDTADLAALVKAAEVLGTFEPAAIDDGRALLHKSFQQMYPTEHISPKMMPAPGSFQRPYLSSSHAAESAGDWTVNMPKSTAVPKAEDYQRGALTAGHQASSPGDHGPNNTAGGGADQYYTMSQKDMAMAAMRSMHDHIAATFAGCCPMAPSRTVMPPGMGATNAPGTMAPPSQGGLNVGKEAGVITEEKLDAAIHEAKAAKKIRKALQAAQAELAKSAPTADPAAIQNMIAEQVSAATGPLNDQIATLRKTVDELGSQPDPAMAPVRGQMARRPAEGTAAPVEKRSLIEEARSRQAEKAAGERESFLAYLRMQTESDDPKVRERAEDLLYKQEVAGARA